jgi:hypothetical protein
VAAVDGFITAGLKVRGGASGVTPVLRGGVCSITAGMGLLGPGPDTCSLDTLRSRTLVLDPALFLPKAQDRLLPSSPSRLLTSVNRAPVSSVFRRRRPGRTREIADASDGEGIGAADRSGGIFPSPKPYEVVPGVEGDKVLARGK